MDTMAGVRSRGKVTHAAAAVTPVRRGGAEDKLGPANKRARYNIRLGLAVGHSQRNIIEYNLDTANTVVGAPPQPPDRHTFTISIVVSIINPQAGQFIAHAFERQRCFLIDLFKITPVYAVGKGGLGICNGIAQ